MRSKVAADGVRFRSTGKIGNLITIESPRRGTSAANTYRVPTMGNEPFTILEETEYEDDAPNVEVIEEELYEEEQEHEDDSASSGSEESDDVVNESVAEDMRKLEESFKGISQRFRLINRIGEGTIPFRCLDQSG